MGPLRLSRSSTHSSVIENSFCSDLRKKVGSFVSSQKRLSRKKGGFLNIERLAESRSKVAGR
jgi:hypothetical protein